jgi:hypothetical protein
VGRRVLDRDHAAVRVAEQKELLQPEVLAQLLEVRGVVGDRVRPRIGGGIGAAGAARIEQHELELVAEAGQIGQVERGEAGPARVADERRPRAGAVEGERAPVPCRHPLRHLARIVARFSCSSRTAPTGRSHL